METQALRVLLHAIVSTSQGPPRVFRQQRNFWISVMDTFSVATGERTNYAPRGCVSHPHVMLPHCNFPPISWVLNSNTFRILISIFVITNKVGCLFRRFS